MKTITNKFKIALLAVGFLAVGTVSAQTTTGDITKQTNATLNSTGTAVKVVDNKGTIKYLQAVNGLTSFTNTTPSGGVVTTWQLGGNLETNTSIGLGTNEFTIDGVNYKIENIAQTTGTAASATTAASDATNANEWTVLVRNEQTGNVEKILATDLLKVEGIRVEHTQGADASADVDITVTGLPTLTAATTAAKLFVYRNGVKLRFGTDFSVTADTVTINYDAAELPMYSGDIVEIQYIK